MASRQQSGIASVILIVVLVIVIIGGGAFFVSKNNKKSSSTSAPATTPASSASSSSTTSSKAFANACDILTQSEAAGVLGLDAAAIKPNASVNGISKAADYTDYDCTYATLDDSDAGYQAVTVSLRRYTTANGAQTWYNTTKGVAADAVDVPGYGEKAYYSAKSGLFYVLNQKDYITAISGHFKTHDQAQAEKAAKLVLQKL